MIVFLSVHTKYAEAILNGSKKYEFRRVVPRGEITTLVLYATAPTKRILGYCQVDGIVSGDPDAVWEECARGAGISWAFFKAYFSGRSRANALRIGEVTRLTNPRSLSCLGEFTVPQSFRYLSKEQWLSIRTPKDDFSAPS